MMPKKVELVTSYNACKKEKIHDEAGTCYGGLMRTGFDVGVQASQEDYDTKKGGRVPYLLSKFVA